MSEIIGIVIVVMVGVFIFLFNSLTMKRNTVENSLAVQNALMKMRRELLCELAGECEDANLQNLNNFVQDSAGVSDICQKAQLDKEISARVADMLADKLPETAEDKSESWMELRDIEKRLIVSRQTLNENIYIFNRAVTTPPTSILARLKKMQVKEYWGDFQPEESAVSE